MLCFYILHQDWFMYWVFSWLFHLMILCYNTLFKESLPITLDNLLNNGLEQSKNDQLRQRRVFFKRHWAEVENIPEELVQVGMGGVWRMWWGWGRGDHDKWSVLRLWELENNIQSEIKVKVLSFGTVISFNIPWGITMASENRTRFRKGRFGITL